MATSHAYDPDAVKSILSRVIDVGASFISYNTRKQLFIITKHENQLKEKTGDKGIVFCDHLIKRPKDQLRKTRKGPNFILFNSRSLSRMSLC